MDQPATYSAFNRHTRLATGALSDVALAVKLTADAGETTIVVLNDRTGRPVDLDLRGSDQEIIARYALAEDQAKPGRGRPKLGVTAREVTLLPRHWDWLAEQPGGASAALRRLVDQARRSTEGRNRQAEDALYRILTTLAGNLPDYEEVLRAFYAGQDQHMIALMQDWPADIAAYVQLQLAACRKPPNDQD